MKVMGSHLLAEMFRFLTPRLGTRFWSKCSDFFTGLLTRRLILDSLLKQEEKGSKRMEPGRRNMFSSKKDSVYQQEWVLQEEGVF